MPVNSENQLRFIEGVTEPLTILKAGQEEFPFGNKMVVHIKETIEGGYDHFLPSPGLEKKMKEENVDIGYIITIEKVEKSEKYEYGYFKIVVVQKGSGADKIEMDKYATGEIKAVGSDTPPMHKSDKKFEKQFETKEDKVGLHELSIRVETLEKEMNELKKNALPF